MEEFDLCPRFQFSQLSLVYYLVSVLFMLLLISLSIVYYRHKAHILSYLYTHCNSCYMLFCCDRQNDEEKMYDCFIAYSSEDREVTLAILQEMETKPPHYSFCIHERNWLSGEYITKNIVSSVQNSRKTLIIFSETFLKSKWFQLEFQAAFQQTLQDRRNRLIVIMKGKIPDKTILDDDVRFVISTKTYLEWGERWFWEKLRYAIHEDEALTYEPKKCDFLYKIPCLKRILKRDSENALSHENIPLNENI